MAYDKVVDSAVLEAGLKASADAIREKTKGTATIPWDVAKGFADAIAAIEAGDGGGVSIEDYNVVTGTFALAENAASYSVTLPRVDESSGDDIYVSGTFFTLFRTHLSEAASGFAVAGFHTLVQAFPTPVNCKFGTRISKTGYGFNILDSATIDFTRQYVGDHYEYTVTVTSTGSNVFAAGEYRWIAAAYRK